MDLSQRYPPQYAHHTQQIRYGLVVRIPGSHPGGPGSIPGNGNIFKCRPTDQLQLPDPGNQTKHDQNFPRRELNPDLLGESQIC